MPDELATPFLAYRLTWRHRLTHLCRRQPVELVHLAWERMVHLGEYAQQPEVLGLQCQVCGSIEMLHLPSLKYTRRVLRAPAPGREN